MTPRALDLQLGAQSPQRSFSLPMFESRLDEWSVSEDLALEQEELALEREQLALEQEQLAMERRFSRTRAAMSMYEKPFDIDDDDDMMVMTMEHPMMIARTASYPQGHMTSPQHPPRQTMAHFGRSRSLPSPRQCGPSSGHEHQLSLANLFSFAPPATVSHGDAGLLRFDLERARLARQGFNAGQRQQRPIPPATFGNMHNNSALHGPTQPSEWNGDCRNPYPLPTMARPAQYRGAMRNSNFRVECYHHAAPDGTATPFDSRRAAPRKRSFPFDAALNPMEDTTFAPLGESRRSVLPHDTFPALEKMRPPIPFVLPDFQSTPARDQDPPTMCDGFDSPNVGTLCAPDLDSQFGDANASPGPSFLDAIKMESDTLMNQPFDDDYFIGCQDLADDRDVDASLNMQSSPATMWND
jgi:hypothetical protein